jgi:hypothetical protein
MSKEKPNPKVGQSSLFFGFVTVSRKVYFPTFGRLKDLIALKAHGFNRPT